MSPKEFLTPEQRRQRNREEVMEDILTISRRMMRADGVAALSFNAIARELGMKPPSLYTYFDSKSAIYDELFRRGFEEFSSRMEHRPHRDGMLEDNIASALETYMRFAQENQDLYQLMFQRPVPEFIPSERSMSVSLNALQQGREEMAKVLRNGELQIDLPLEEAHDLFISLMHGMTELHLANNPELPVGEGRFGKLIEPAVKFLLAAWNPKKS